MEEKKKKRGEMRRDVEEKGKDARKPVRVKKEVKKENPWEKKIDDSLVILKADLLMQRLGSRQTLGVCSPSD